MAKKKIGQAKIFSQVSEIERFVETSKLKYLNKMFRIENISSTSKIFFYLGLIGVVLITISLIVPSFWISCWIYVFVLIVLSGFIFAKPGTKFNPVLVIGIFVFLMFVPSVYRESMLSTTLDASNPRTYNVLDASSGSRFDVEIMQIEAQLEPKIKNGYTLHDLRANIIISRATYDDCHKYFTGYVNNPYDLEFDTRNKLARYYNLVVNPTYEGEVAQDWVLDWESYLVSYLKSSSDKAHVRNMIIDGDNYADVKKYYMSLDNKHDRALGYYCTLLYQYRAEIGGLTEPEIDNNQDFRTNVTEDATEYETFDISGFMDSLNKLTGNPLEDLSSYVSNFMDVMNWILFLAILSYGGSVVVDGIKLDLGAAAKKLAQIGLAIAVMVFIYSMFQAVDIEVRTVFDTVGNAWSNLMSSLGFGMMDASGNTIITANSTVDGIYRIIPIILSFMCFGMAYGFRKTDLKSVIFAKSITDDDMIEVETTKFSISTGIILLAMGMYLVGYFLITAEPTVVVNPFITIVFYIFAIVVLLLMGNKFLITSKEKDVKSFAWRTVKWTIFGLMGLFMWFGVFQPAMVQLNLTDSLNSLMILSQGENIFETNFMEQLFLVAAPETLIFQIFFIGIGNRIYFYFRKTRLTKDTLKMMKQEMWSLAVQFKSIQIDPNSSSTENVKKIAKAVVLKQKIEDIGLKIEEKIVTRVPLGFFVMSTIISACAGSFFFSWYHSFRRGIDFITWWQNPVLGLTYFGAGFFLCLIAFFSFPASILVHAFNNIIAIFMMGG